MSDTMKQSGQGHARQKGIWIKLYKGQKESICSECNAEFDRQTNYCPNCGAKMLETIVNDGKTDCPWK